MKAHFDAALELDPEERAAYVHQVRASDGALGNELNALLANDAEAGDFMESPVQNASVTTSLLRDEPSMVGRRTGAYELLEEIGHGGMGTVYRAVRADDQFDQQVAVKVVRGDPRAGVIARRFRDERQILASLDHPNIARLLDGGTTDDGLPYFIMEYVNGLPVDEYADTHRLSVNDRLKLFQTACSAVHYAHQHLIVHRDIKPANILVTMGGGLKLLDFGIAKVLNDEFVVPTAGRTLPGLDPMTPEYASPEQILGGDVTTATDIYSLGVVLYKLLSGHRPYPLTAYDCAEIGRAICEAEPNKPSAAVDRVEEIIGPDGRSTALTAELVSAARNDRPERLRRRLSGDLDHIVLKALRKEPALRYASVEQFSDDIARHLNGRPVLAREGTLGYQAVKFVRRHSAGVAAAALVLLSLVGGLVMTARQARIATTQRVRAELRSDEVRRLASSLIFEMHDAIEYLPGSTPARNLLVKKGLTYLDGLARETGENPSLQGEIAAAYEKLGDVQGNLYRSNLGDTAGALESYSKSLAIREAIVRTTPTSLEARASVADSQSRIAMALLETGDLPSALATSRTALETRQVITAQLPHSEAAQSKLGLSHDELADILVEARDFATALEHYQQGLAIFTSLTEINPTDRQARRRVSIATKKIGGILEEMGKIPEALEKYRYALAIDEAAAIADPANTLGRIDLSISQANIGDILTKVGDLRGALDQYKKASAIAERLSADDPTDVRPLHYVASTRLKIGQTLSKLGDRAGAIASFKRAQFAEEARTAVDPRDTKSRADLAGVYSQFGDLHASLADDPQRTSRARRASWQDARAWYQKSLDIWLELERSGAVAPVNSAAPKTILRAIARCDAALAAGVRLRTVKPSRTTRPRRQTGSMPAESSRLPERQPAHVLRSRRGLCRLPARKAGVELPTCLNVGPTIERAQRVNRRHSRAKRRRVCIDHVIARRV